MALRQTRFVLHGKLLDDQTDRITAVGATVDIDSQSEAVAAAKTERPTWGSSWLSKYVPHPETPPDGALPSEIQQPWGRVLVDPHWSHVQVYETPIPLWPIQLRAGLEIPRHHQVQDTHQPGRVAVGSDDDGARLGDGYRAGRARSRRCDTRI